jgi:hypothetical protein
MARSSASSRALTDQGAIRRWAEERGAQPARVRSTGSDDDVGIIRLDFPGYSGEDSLEEVSWDEWFGKFEESNLALLVQDETASGEKSNFNKLVGRDQTELGTQRSRRRSSSAKTAGASSKSAGGRASRKTNARARQASGGGRSRNSASGKTEKSTSRSTAGKKGAARATQARGKKTGSRRSGRRAA